MAWVGGALAGGGALLGGLSSGQGGSHSNDLKVKPTTTLTPQQQLLLDDLLNKATSRTGEFTDQGQKGQFAFPGDAGAGSVPLENLSLTALENRVNQIGQGGNPLEQATNQSLLDIIKGGGTPTGGQTFDNFFNASVEKPLTQQFNDQFQQLGTRFGGNNLFSSNRAEADSRAKKDFLDALTNSRGTLAFQDRTNSQQNLIAALGLSEANAGKSTDELGKIAAIGQNERAANQTAQDARFKQFLSEQALKQNQLDNLMKLISTPAFENIASAGTKSSIAPGLISAGGSILGSLFSNPNIFGAPTKQTVG